MSSSAESDTPIIEEGHVRLILLQAENSSFHLDIPLEIIQRLCLKPLKYLRFLGWCIFGVEGVLAYESDGDAIDTNENLQEHEIYYYVRPDDADLACAVDIEVIRARTHIPSETTSTQDEFRRKLMERDPHCVWTGFPEDACSGMHIIPHRRGSEWLRLIIENRPKNGENVTGLGDINDIRNGFLAMDVVHRYFDPRKIAILKTPNRILETTDVPPRHHRASMPSNTNYPSGDRYTLQWLMNPDPIVAATIPNNVDAAFKTNSRKLKPSDLLLHYNYGAAAVKLWGHGTDLLQNLAKPPRPSKPVPPPMGPSKTTHDRIRAIEKRGRPPRTRGGRRRTTAARAGEMIELEGQASWDEDDVILFCWGNSPAAKERYLKKAEETTRRMETWRESVSRGST